MAKQIENNNTDPGISFISFGNVESCWNFDKVSICFWDWTNLAIL